MNNLPYDYKCKINHIQYFKQFPYQVLHGISTGHMYGESNSWSVYLNGVEWQFVEDEDDGYRSTMHQPVVSLGWRTEIENEIPHRPFVHCEWFNYDSSTNFVFDGLVLTNPQTQDEICRVGTDFSDDYYPCVEWKWNPEYLPTPQELI